MYTWPNFRKITDARERENIRQLTSYAIQSQYSASAKMLALAAQYQEHIDPSPDVDLFYEKMIDIYQAEGSGLDNWGQILQMGRVISDPDSGAAIYLDDEHYRLLLLYKAMANIASCDADTQNKLLSVLTGTGIGELGKVAYVLQVGPMVIRWVFESRMTPEQLAIFKVAGTLARGAGVGWELYHLNTAQTFGFAGAGMQPFNQAPFAPADALHIN